MIFRKLLDLDLKVCGGVQSDGHLDRLKKWFYYGLKVRQHLSNCKISGEGQKLPGDWEEALKNMHGRMRAV